MGGRGVSGGVGRGEDRECETLSADRNNEQTAKKEKVRLSLSQTIGTFTSLEILARGGRERGVYIYELCRCVSC